MYRVWVIIRHTASFGNDSTTCAAVFMDAMQVWNFFKPFADEDMLETKLLATHGDMVIEGESISLTSFLSSPTFLAYDSRPLFKRMEITGLGGYVDWTIEERIIGEPLPLDFLHSLGKG